MFHGKDLVQSIIDNGVLILEFLGIVLFMVLFAYLVEKIAKKRRKDTERVLNVRTIAVVGMFSAISGVFMTLELPLPFIAPEFYALDASELPALLAGFAFGPVAAVLVEFIKLPIKLLFKPSSTAVVGEIANFMVGCSFLLPATVIYQFKKSKRSAIIGCIVGCLMMTVFGALMNAYYLLPVFAKMFFGGDLPGIIAMGTKINPAIKDVQTFAAFAVAPMNLIKSGGVSILTMLLYKPLSPVLKSSSHSKKKAA